MNCTPATLAFYRYTAGAFLKWAELQSVTDPQEITARHVRAYLAQLISQGRKDTTVHDHARAVRTLLRFWHAEGYMQPVTFDMPRLEKKRLPVLSSGELYQIVKACNVRDKAIVLFMVDSGLRRQEVINLNWSDVDIQTGLVRVKQGKGKKDRSAVIGAVTRRALLAYRRYHDGKGRNWLHRATGSGGLIVKPPEENAPLFQTRTGSRFTGNGLMMFFRRLSKRTGIQVTAHALRRTFVILSLRAGMNPLYLQHLGGWTSLDMVDHYAQLEDIDLMQEHAKYSPVDNLR